MDKNDFVRLRQSLCQGLENRSDAKDAPSRYPGSIPGMDQFVADEPTSPCQGQHQKLDQKLSRKVFHKDQFCPPCSLSYILMISSCNLKTQPS